MGYNIPTANKKIKLDIDALVTHHIESPYNYEKYKKRLGYELKKTEATRKQNGLRDDYGPVCVDGEWRTRYNHELYSLYKDDQVTKKIRVQRLRWLGHLARINDDNVGKRVFERNLEGRRRIGHPKLRWKDSVLEDYQMLGVGLAWRTAALT